LTDEQHLNKPEGIRHNSTAFCTLHCYGTTGWHVEAAWRLVQVCPASQSADGDQTTPEHNPKATTTVQPGCCYCTATVLLLHCRLQTTGCCWTAGPAATVTTQHKSCARRHLPPATRLTCFVIATAASLSSSLGPLLLMMPLLSRTILVVITSGLLLRLLRWGGGPPYR
jgi:hypothetical protein